MKNIKKLTVFVLAGLLLLATGCSENELAEPDIKASLENQSNSTIKAAKIHYGPYVDLGPGKVRSWIAEDETGHPLAIGVRLPEDVIFNLGDDPKVFTLPLPKEAVFPPFHHIQFDWNPQGHEPEGIYSVPHFDLHFYMISKEKQAAIPGKLPPYMDPAPASKYLPQAYVQGPGLVPQMGAHWVDVLSPEFQQKGFTRTFIWGTYNKKVIFQEPMFTVDYLKTKPDETIELRQPQAFQCEGIYPTNYSFKYDKTCKEYVITLGGLVHRKAN